MGAAVVAAEGRVARDSVWDTADTRAAAGAMRGGRRGHSCAVAAMADSGHSTRQPRTRTTSDIPGVAAAAALRNVTPSAACPDSAATPALFVLVLDRAAGVLMVSGSVVCRLPDCRVAEARHTWDREDSAVLVAEARPEDCLPVAVSSSKGAVAAAPPTC